MKTKLIWSTVAAALLVSGCARLAIYNDASLANDKETGIKFYTAKPYLLVARTGNKDKPIDVSVIYLPDMSKPLYAKPIAGYGSATLSMAYSNGMITAFGQQTDSKIPESLAGIGGLGKAIAEARKINREAMGVQTQSSIDYTKFVKPLRDIADDIRLRATEDTVNKGEISKPEAHLLTTWARQIGEAADKLADPTQADRNVPVALMTLKGIAEAWKKQILPGAPEKRIRQALLADKANLESVIAGMTPKAPDEATFTIYEIDNSSGDMRLKEVQL
jgi:hypothetical protein